MTTKFFQLTDETFERLSRVLGDHMVDPSDCFLKSELK